MPAPLLRRLGTTEMFGSGGKLLGMILFWGCGCFELLRVHPNGRGCLYRGETPILLIPLF